MDKQGDAMNASELRAEVTVAEQAVRDAEVALLFAQDRLQKLKHAVHNLDAEGVAFYNGEAVWVETPRKPTGFVEFDNEIPPALVERARQTGLRDFFSAPKDAP